MANSTLYNLAGSAFVRTDPVLSVRIGRYLLDLPDTPCNVFDPSSGEGDLFYTIAHASGEVRIFGTEISEERASVSRGRWPHATILTSAFEAVHIPAGCMDVVICNPPYFFQNGRRAEYRFIADSGENLVPGGIMVAIIPARSAWDGTMINHWLKWYDNVGVWKFPNRVREDQEGAFDDYTQIVVIGVRRAEPQIPSPAEKSRLTGYQWRDPENAGQSGWKHGEPPPDIPTGPTPDAYRVPSSRTIPQLVVRHADEAMLLYALDKTGAHLAPSWQQVTEWPEEGYHEPPAMPLTGEAHVAAEVMVGALDGNIVYGPGSGPDAQAHVFTAFVGSEWVEMPIDDELLDKLREQGCVSVKMRQLTDKPILGVLNLHTGITRYYQSEEVFTFLQPWLNTLASRVIERRKPLYQLDPADWEIILLSQFATDKRLPKALYAGLAVPQMHRVLAMCRSMDVRGRTAIQGEPGTGKTRMATATAIRQAYLWRHRTGQFSHRIQPAWIRGLRQAWLKNPRTLAMLDLEPVLGWRIRDERIAGAAAEMLERSPHPHIIAYRERRTGRMVAPENAGPQALPVLIATPLKVTKEYGKEILAAFPKAEIVPIESHRDIPRWLERCVHSSAPVVFGIFSHSTTRAFGREWLPAVREKLVTRREPDLHPPTDLLDELEAVYERGRSRKVVAYRFKGTDTILTKKVTATYYYCYECGGLISAVPGKTNQPDEDEKKRSGKGAKGSVQAARSERSEETNEKKEDKLEPVTSLTYFTTKQRWCKCLSTRRNEERLGQGKPILKNPLWTDERVATTRRRYPSCAFRDWSAAMANLSRAAQYAARHASSRELAEQVRRHEGMLRHLVEIVLADREHAGSVLELVERVDGSVATLIQQREQAAQALRQSVLQAAMQSPVFLRDLVLCERTRAGVGDEELLDRLVRHALPYTGIGSAERSELLEARESLQEQQAQLNERVCTAIQQGQEAVVFLLDLLKSLLKETMARQLLISEFTIQEPSMKLSVETLERAPRGDLTLLHLLSRCALHNKVFCALVVRLGLQGEPSLSQALLAKAQGDDPEVESARRVITELQEHLLESVLVAARDRAHLFQEVAEEVLQMPIPFATMLSTLARRDIASLSQFVGLESESERTLQQQVAVLRMSEEQLVGVVEQVARRDGSHSILLRLVELTRTQVNWDAHYFRMEVARAHLYSQATAGKSARSKKSGGLLGSSLEGSTSPSRAVDVRLAVATGGPITVTRPDLDAAKGYNEVRDGDGQISAYQMGHQGRTLVPVYSAWSKRLTGFVDQQTGKVVTSETHFGFCAPPADSFSPYESLYEFYRGCVALSVVDESHNGRNKTTDIGHSHHFAMLSAQLRELTSGTHYGGDILGFFHYWYRFNPSLWLRLGYGWEDAEQALSHYGVIQEWTKEFETDARKGTGQTDVRVSTIPAPGLSAKLIPHLLEDLTYLTVLDVGAHMPPKREIPKGISMNDLQVEEAVKRVRQAYADALASMHEIAKERNALEADSEMDEQEREALLAELEEREVRAKRVRDEAAKASSDTQDWAAARNLADHYITLTRTLDGLAQEGNAAARLAKGTIPRWFSALPCESAFEVYSTLRGDWGDKLGKELVIRTNVLEWNYLYPLERWMIDTVRAELEEGRRIMIYFEQNAVRSKARRLEWVLKEFHPWTLPNSVEAEDRQQAIIDAVHKEGHQVVIVPYKRVNEGLNLHTAIDTIIWDELAMNLFMYYQASQRAWRLGKENEVRIYLPFYVGTAAHTKLRKLGGQSGAAAAFAGEPAKGELIHHVGADKTTLARLSASLEVNEEADATAWEASDVATDLAEIEANFARRNEELQEALKRGRVWFGLEDSLPARLEAIIAEGHPDMWATLSQLTSLQSGSMFPTAASLLARREQIASVVEGTVHVAAGQQTSEAAAETFEFKDESAATRAVPATSSTHQGESDSGAVMVYPVEEQAVQVAVIVFGSEEDIRRVRARHKGKPRRQPKPKNKTQLKHIPSVQQASIGQSKVEIDSNLELRPLWDLGVVTSEDGEEATLTITPAPSLWE